MFILVKGIDTLEKPALPAGNRNSLYIIACSKQCYDRLDSSTNNVLCCVFRAGKFVAAQMHVAGKSYRIAPTRWRSLYLLSVHWQDVAVQVCVAAGELPTVQELAQELQGRLLVLSLARLLGMSWCDGYLAHINAGKILSYVARPGYLCLRVPLQAQAQGIEHLPTSLQQDWDYLALQQTLRSYLKQEQLPLHVDDYSCAAAVCLVAVVKVFACTAVQIDTPNPAWKRLLQNLGVHTVETGKQPISQLLPLVNTKALPAITASINRRGSILPASFFVCGYD